MVKNPPDGMPACCPYLLYDDPGAAVDFLTKAFGFETTERPRMRSWGKGPR